VHVYEEARFSRVATTEMTSALDQYNALTIVHILKAQHDILQSTQNLILMILDMFIITVVL
jgi:hypothetical protein